ncbi:MAG: CinA family nicotinamide mononucleotide deamidase-related protein [Alphaproteobacteria bacterium]|nr:CinA family nicotinamide mononucleotide deamidase-related protein [Alphaproteobacteria bacterium]
MSQGDEVLTGQTVDTNAAWLAARLTELGVRVVRHVTVGDEVEAIRGALAAAAAEASLVICTGGLGPTADDLTAEAVALAFAAPLALDEVALAHVEGLYRAFGRAMPPSNRKQALLPARSLRLDNPHGTACGFALEHGGAWVACLPGVPREMKPMFETQVLPRVVARLQLAPGRLVTLRTTGVGESTLQDRIGAFAHPAAVLGYRTSLGENQIKLRFTAGTPDDEVRALVADVAARIGSPVFAVDGLDGLGGGLAATVGAALVAQGHTLAVAESCTGGQLSALCTAEPGASAWFLEGAVVYDNAAKVARAGVPAALLEAHGAVSEPVARALAEGIRTALGATHGLATTGIAGPSGGSEAKPVGTVHLAHASPHGTTHRLVRLAGDRERIQGLAAHAVLDLLRRHLQGLHPADAAPPPR